MAITEIRVKLQINVSSFHFYNILDFIHFKNLRVNPCSIHTKNIPKFVVHKTEQQRDHLGSHLKKPDNRSTFLTSYQKASSTPA